MLSLNRIDFLQEKQCDLGLIMLIFFGTLYITTFKKLPTIDPKIKRKGIKRVSGKELTLLPPALLRLSVL